ncbi:hypothetical protein ACRN9A_16685 [Shewanella frigidimarina]|uniref:hypothetical protein n=1 Tax=Shewanella frigidimarina TaxID=56812 RepID=UPI003D793B68
MITGNLFDFYKKPTTTFSLEPHWQLIDTVANNSFKSYSDGSGQKQAKNTITGCIVGAMGELAAYLVLSELFNTVVAADFLHYATSCKKNKTSFSDIMIFDGDRPIRLEIKTCQSHHPQNCVTPYHLKKYIKDSTDAIVFISVNIKNKTATINGIVEPTEAQKNGKRIVTICDNIDCTEIIIPM